MSTLARQKVSNGTAPSESCDSIDRVSVDEFLIKYTNTAIVYADIFKVPSTDDQDVLAAGASAGEHVNVVLAAGSSDLTAQPIVTSALLIIE